MKYELGSFKAKDGTIIYHVLKVTDAFMFRGMPFQNKEIVFSGTKAECEEKLKELENRK
jgi:hypothetical protein